MIYLVIGGAIAIALVLLMRWFVAADVTQVARAIRWIAVVAAAALGLYLVLTGRWALIIPIVGAAALWMSRRRAGLARWPPFAGGGRSGKSSSVETRFFRMSLDHGSGMMRGVVREGPHAGDIGRLSLEELLSLLDQCRVEDPQSAQLLEAYLDRQHSDWRERATDSSESGEAPPRSGMTRDEACRILGVEADATENQIRDAHRRLMGKLHPDRGGSDYLAAQINRAKDILLGT